jgi:hypothetical protein
VRRGHDPSRLACLNRIPIAVPAGRINRNWVDFLPTDSISLVVVFDIHILSWRGCQVSPILRILSLHARSLALAQEPLRTSSSVRIKRSRNDVGDLDPPHCLQCRKLIVHDRANAPNPNRRHYALLTYWAHPLRPILYKCVSYLKRTGFRPVGGCV